MLRGVNVSGHRKIKMADLRQALTQAGFKGVTTYIQSGNIILEEEEGKETVVENKLRSLIKKEFGHEVEVIVISPEYLQSIIDNNPFILDKPEEDIKKLYITFLKQAPDDLSLDSLDRDKFLPDRYALDDRVIYIRFAEGAGKSKMNLKFFEGKLKVSGTSRNWRTVNKLLRMSQEK